MNCSQKLDSEVKKGNLWTSSLFPHPQWATCGPQRLLWWQRQMTVLNLPSKSMGSLQLCWNRSDWGGWVGTGTVAGAGEISQLCIPDPGEPQLLGNAAQLCKVTTSSVPWAGKTLYHTGCAFRDDKQRNIWADVEPQNIWKLRKDMAKEINFLLCDLHLNTPAVKWPSLQKKNPKLCKHLFETLIKVWTIEFLSCNLKAIL